MFTKPIIRDIKPFDALAGATILFGVQSGPQVIRNKIIIKDSVTNSVIYEAVQETFLLQHIIPPSETLPINNRLINGNSYVVTVQVGDINNNWSIESDPEIFWVFSSPTISFINIDQYGKIYNQTETFVATYTHPENELLQYYKYYLYDSNQNLITSFDITFNDGSSPLIQEITGFVTSLSYYVEVKTLSQNGQESTSGLVDFSVQYIAPRLLTTLEVENYPSVGAVKFSANILQIILHLIDNLGNEINYNDVEYLNSTWIDMNRIDYAKLIANEGFSILQSNFMLQMWMKNLIENENILQLYGSSGSLIIKYYDNRLHAFKTQIGTDLSAHFVSETFAIAENEIVSFRVTHVNNLINLEIYVGGEVL